MVCIVDRIVYFHISTVLRCQLGFTVFRDALAPWVVPFPRKKAALDAFVCISAGIRAVLTAE